MAKKHKTQSRSSSPKTGKTAAKAALLTAVEACAFLGVKAQTLYAYVSRGWLHAEASPEGRGKLYRRDELEAIKDRSRARSGHGPTAASAMRWGEPILESAVTCAQRGMLYYRGYALSDLLRHQVRFENVAELLWSGELPRQSLVWPHAISATTPPSAPPKSGALLTRRLMAMVSQCALHEEGGGDELLDDALARVRHLIISAIPVAFPPISSLGKVSSPSVASQIAAHVGLPDDEAAEHAIQSALVACADHELNASTFAARVAASTGADMYACLMAALGAFAGPRHGLFASHINNFIDRCHRPDKARALIDEHMQHRDALPGFGHPLYAEGDPRTPSLIAAARHLAQKRNHSIQQRMAIIDALMDAAQAGGSPAPGVDWGLVAVATALGVPATGAVGLFALGRMAGWAAHVIEQRQKDIILRPRARYVGRSPTALTTIGFQAGQEA